MSTNLPLSQAQLYLPNIQSIQTSEQAFGDAFLIAAQILVRHLEQIKAAIEVIKDFTTDPFNLASLGLFSKMYRNYYSYVLLEIHHDRNRSRGGLQKNQTLSSGRQLGHSRRSRVIFNTRPELNVREKSRGYVMRMNFKTLLSKSFRTYAHINSLPKMSIRQLANQYSSFNYSQLSRKN